MKNKTSIVILGDFSEWWGVNKVDFYNAIAKNVDEIDVFLSSYGGDVGEALAIYDMLKGHKAKVTIYLSGIVASAATIVACSGDRVIASPTNIYMVHKANWFSFGNSNDMRYAADVLDVFDEKIVSIYERKVKGKIKKDNIWKLMNDSTWMTSESAVELGLVDGVEDFSFDFDGQRISWGLFASNPKEIDVVSNYTTSLKAIQNYFQTNSKQYKSSNMKVFNSITEKVVAALVSVGLISDENKDKASQAISEINVEDSAIQNMISSEVSNHIKAQSDKLTKLETDIENQKSSFEDFKKSITDKIGSAEFLGIKNSSSGNGPSSSPPNTGDPLPKASGPKLELFRKALNDGRITKEEFKEATGLES